MPRYVDGFVLSVPKKNLPAYKKMAAKAGKIWMEYGALEYVECVGDDLHIPKVFSFVDMAKPKAGETVCFSFIVFKSRAHRDAVNKKVMADPRLHCDENGEDASKKMPFDWKRMAYGGFQSIVDLS
jgi:uncharacterized protein YbaA (DUF1428 family)